MLSGRVVRPVPQLSRRHQRNIRHRPRRAGDARECAAVHDPDRRPRDPDRDSAFWRQDEPCRLHRGLPDRVVLRVRAGQGEGREGRPALGRTRHRGPARAHEQQDRVPEKRVRASPQGILPACRPRRDGRCPRRPETGHPVVPATIPRHFSGDGLQRHSRVHPPTRRGPQQLCGPVAEVACEAVRRRARRRRTLPEQGDSPGRSANDAPCLAPEGHGLRRPHAEPVPRALGIHAVLPVWQRPV